MKRFAALAGLVWVALVLTGCGGGSRANGTTTATTQPERTLAFRLYFLREGKVATVGRSIPHTKAVAGAALEALTAGPLQAERSVGLRTALPEGATFRDLRIDGGVAFVTPPERLTRHAQAQMVYTLTQFPTVQAVEIGGRRLGRSDFEQETPQILVESPAPFETISSPLRIRGTANTFEATFIVELLLNAAGRRAFHRFVTATSGSGTRGTFDVTIPFTVRRSGPTTLVAYEESAEDGRPLHRVEIPLTLKS